MKNLFRFILAFALLCAARAQNVNGGGTSASSTSTVSKIVDDTTTNATVFPVWVTANSGNLPLKVTSTKLGYNPSTGRLTITGPLTVTGHLTLEGVTSAGATGTNNLVFSTSPTFITPTLGAASATSLTLTNGGAITDGGTGAVTVTASGTNQSVTLTPSGTGSVVGPVGAVGTPAFTFLGDTDTGIYHPTANAVAFATNGALALTLDSSQDATFVGNEIIPQAKALKFASTTTGLTYNAGADQLILRGGSANQLVVSGSDTRLSSGQQFGWCATAAGSGGGTTGGNDSYFTRISAGVIGINTTLSSIGATSLVLASNATAALTLDSSQNAAFAGTVKSSGFARVTGDVTNATATMSNLTNLSVTVASGTKYVGTIQIFANDSTGADGLAFDLGGGAATFTDLEFGFAAQPTGSTLGTVTSTTSTSAITLTVVSTSDAVYTVSFGFTCNAGGTFIPRFAQNSHSAGTATVRKNSGIITLASTN